MTSAPHLTFETERLRFEPLSLDDLDLAIEQWTDPEVVRYVGDYTYSKAELVEEMPKFVRRCADGCIGVWRLTERATGEKIGTAILLPSPVELDDTDWDLVTGDEIPEGDIEVGYVLKRSAWGKGYATEACARMLRFAFEATALAEVMATTDHENLASQSVLKKCGMIPVGLIRAYRGDFPGFRLTREEWRRNCA